MSLGGGGCSKPRSRRGGGWLGVGGQSIREETGGWKMGHRGAGTAAGDRIVTDRRYQWVPKPKPHNTDGDFEAQEGQVPTQSDTELRVPEQGARVVPRRGAHPSLA